MIEFLVAAAILYLTVSWFLGKLQISRKHEEFYVVVTGCDSGFGRDLAYKLDKENFNVFAACLTREAAEELDNTTSNRLQTIVVDITKKDSVFNLYETVNKSLPNEKALWGVVNNAGIIGLVAPAALTTKSECAAVLDVNLFGMMEVNYYFIPLLRKSKGRIINVASGAGRLALIYTSYCISKYGVEAYSDCLRRELYHQAVTVHIIEPGTFVTPMYRLQTKEFFKEHYDRAIAKLPIQDQKYYGPDYSRRIGETFERFVDKLASKNKRIVMDAFYHALTARYPRKRYVVGFDTYVGVTLLSMCPEWLSDLLVATFSTESVKPAGVLEYTD